MIYIGIKNVPEEARTYMPVIYLEDGYDAPATNMNHEALWATDIESGTYDMRFIIYSSMVGEYEQLAAKDINNVKLEDEKQYIFDWKTGSFSGAGNAAKWAIAGVCGLVGAGLVALSLKKK